MLAPQSVIQEHTTYLAHQRLVLSVLGESLVLIRQYLQLRAPRVKLVQMVRQAALNALLDMLVPTSVIRHRTLLVLRVPTLLPLTHFVQNALLDPTVQLQMLLWSCPVHQEPTPSGMLQFAHHVLRAVSARALMDQISRLACQEHTPLLNRQSAQFVRLDMLAQTQTQNYPYMPAHQGCIP